MIKPGTLVRVVSPTGRVTSLAYVSCCQYTDGQWLVKLERRAGWVPVERIKPLTGDKL